MLRAGTFPVDLNGINAAGWDQIGTALDKAHLLTDATAALLGLSGDPSVNDALAALSNGKANVFSGSYVGTGSFGSGNLNTLTFPFTPKIVGIVPVGGVSVYTPMLSAYLWGNKLFKATVDNTVQNCVATVNGNTLSWYCVVSSEFQFNASGRTYNYFAIG